MDKVKEVAVTITAYIAIPVALCFPVGLFALWLGFIHYYGFQFSTAFEAAALVDRNIVVGRGASILLIPLIASVLFSWCIGFVYWLFGARPLLHIWRILVLLVLSVFSAGLFMWYIQMQYYGKFVWPWHYESSVVGVTILSHDRDCNLEIIGDLALKDAIASSPSDTVNLLPGAKEKDPLKDPSLDNWVKRLSANGKVKYFSNGDESVWLFSDAQDTTVAATKVFIGHSFWYKVLLPAIIFAVGVWVGGYFIYRNFSKYQALARYKRNKENYEYRPWPSFFINGLLDRWISFGLLLTYTISVIAVLVLSFFLPVTLPYMWYSIPASTNNPTTSADKYRQGTPTYEQAGRLLGHSNGYWYAISHPICYSYSGKRFTKKDEYYRSIMAIPDKTVKDVEVLNPG